MSNSIYISNSEIQLIKYERSGDKIRIIKNISFELPEGCMINGVITDSQVLTDQLKKLKEEVPTYFHNLSLTIDTHSILAKKIPVPSLKKEKYYLVVEDELKGRLSAYSTHLFDFSYISKKRKETYILGVGADKESIETYLTVFRDADIKLERVNVGVETILRYLAAYNHNREDTYAFTIIEKLSMVSFIFEKGEFVFSIRSRIVGDTLEQQGQSIIQSLSQLVQFNKNITQSYYIGASDELLQFMQNNYLYSEVTIKPFELIKKTTKRLNGGVASSPFALFGAYADKKYINFLDTIKREQKKVKKKSRPVRFKPVYTLLLALPLLFIATYAYYFIQNEKLTKENNRIKKYLNSQQIIEQQTQMKSFQQEREHLLKIGENIQLGVQDRNQITSLNSSIMHSIYGLAGEMIRIQSISYDASNRMMTVQASSLSQLGVSSYLLSLKNTNLFDDIQYSGYQGNDSNTEYSFQLKAVLQSETDSTKK